MITTQIINRIIDDDLVVVNLTGNNPNVMYELCLRHVVAKPIIHICENGTTLPFDIKDSRTVFYENDMLGVEELKSGLKEYMDEMDYLKEYSDNPIYNATKMGLLLKHFPNEDGKSMEIALLQKIYEKIDTNNILINNRACDSSLVENIFDYSKYYYKTSIKQCNKTDLHMIKNSIQTELRKRNVFLFNNKGNDMFFQNRGNTTDNRIKEVISDIEKKFDAKIEIMKYTGEFGYLI